MTERLQLLAGKHSDNNNSVEMLKDVTAENDELTLNADRAVYNKITNKVKAFGKVLVNYKMKK
ncbi:MAG: OstA-like protein [Fusobacterium sp.]